MVTCVAQRGVPANQYRQPKQWPASPFTSFISSKHGCSTRKRRAGTRQRLRCKFGLVWVYNMKHVSCCTCLTCLCAWSCAWLLSVESKLESSRAKESSNETSNLELTKPLHLVSQEFLKKECAEGLKGRLSGIMRKLSVRQSDEESVIDLSGRTENRHDLRNTLKFFEDFTLKECALHGQHQSQPACRMSSSIPESVRNWPEGGIKPKGGADWLRDSASTKMKSSNSKSVKEEPISSVFLTLHKKSASEDIEGADWEIFSGGNSEGLAEPKDGSHHRHGLRATLKACSLKWRKSVKRLDKSLQDGSIPLQDCWHGDRNFSFFAEPTSLTW